MCSGSDVEDDYKKVTWNFVLVDVRVSAFHGNTAFERSVELANLFPICRILMDAWKIQSYSGRKGTQSPVFTHTHTYK